MIKDEFDKLVMGKKTNSKYTIQRFFSGIAGSVILLTMGGNIADIRVSAHSGEMELFKHNFNSYSNVYEVDNFKNFGSDSLIETTQSNSLNQAVDQDSYIYNPELNFLLFNYSNVDNQNLLMFPNAIETLKLYYCPFINDLSYIPEKYPNLKFLEIYCCPSISDLSFIYNMKNIETIYIFESAFVTEELINYLNSHNINHNITQKDIENSKKVDDIVNRLIDDEMEDEEKIQTICSYIIDTYSYDIEKMIQSNEAPLTTMLEGDTCVCAGYAYFTNVLLTKANINSYEIISDDHGWNLIELDGKFYYIDTTNIEQVPFISRLFLEKFNMGFYYMTSPDDTSFSLMKDYDSDLIIIPQSLVDDIKQGESEKKLYEKYGRSVPGRIIELLITLISIPLLIKGTKIAKSKRKIKK